MEPYKKPYSDTVRQLIASRNHFRKDAFAWWALGPRKECFGPSPLSLLADILAAPPPPLFLLRYPPPLPLFSVKKNPAPATCSDAFFLFSRRRKRWKTNGEKWWIFGADFLTVWCRFFTVYADFSRFIRDINGEKQISLLMIVFSRLVFHGLPPLDFPRPRTDIKIEYVNGVFQTGFLSFGFGVVGKGGLERGWGGVGEGLGRGLGRGLGEGWGGLGFLYFKNPVWKTPLTFPRIKIKNYPKRPASLWSFWPRWVIRRTLKGGANRRALLGGCKTSFLGDPPPPLTVSSAFGPFREGLQYDVHPLGGKYVLHPSLAFSGQYVQDFHFLLQDPPDPGRVSVPRTPF